MLAFWGHCWVKKFSPTPPLPHSPTPLLPTPSFPGRSIIQWIQKHQDSEYVGSGIDALWYLVVGEDN